MIFHRRSIPSLARCAGLLAVVTGLGLPEAGHATTNHYSATSLWQTDVGYQSQSSPAAATNATIYVTTADGRLLALNADGSPQWVFRFHFESFSTPAVGTDGSIYFGARNRHLYAVDAKGAKKWAFRTGGWVDASPALGEDGSVYCGSWDKKFYALAPDGRKRWEFKTGGPIISSAAIDTAGGIYFGSHDHKFYALNPDGTKRWEFATRGAISSSPAVGAEGELYFTSVDGNLYALNADGTQRWALRTGGMTPSSPVLGPDGNIFLSVNQTHCAISHAGKLLWQRGFWNPHPGGFGETAAAVRADGSVVFAGGDGYVMTVATDSGDKDWLWNYWLYGRSYSAPLILPQGQVVVMSTAGKMSKLDQQVPLANSPWPMFRGNPQRTGRIYTPSAHTSTTEASGHDAAQNSTP
jgi:outer membrane protein assembly factor BamB